MSAPFATRNRSLSLPSLCLCALLLLLAVAQAGQDNTVYVECYFYDQSGHAGMETDYTPVLDPPGSRLRVFFPDTEMLEMPLKVMHRPVDQHGGTPFFFQYTNEATPTVAGLWEVNAGKLNVAIPVHGHDFGMRPHSIDISAYWPSGVEVSDVGFFPWIGDHPSSPTLILWQPGLPPEILAGRKMSATFEYLPGCSLHGKAPDHVEAILPGAAGLNYFYVLWGAAGRSLPSYYDARLDERVCTGPVRATLSLEGYTTSTVLLEVVNQRSIEFQPLFAPASPGSRGPTQLFQDYGFDLTPFEPWPIDGDAFPVGHLAEYRRQQPASNSTGWLAR